jgi:hypothetical protein
MPLRIRKEPKLKMVIDKSRVLLVSNLPFMKDREIKIIIVKIIKYNTDGNIAGA